MIRLPRDDRRSLYKRKTVWLAWKLIPDIIKVVVLQRLCTRVSPVRVIDQQFINKVNTAFGNMLQVPFDSLSFLMWEVELELHIWVLFKPIQHFHAWGSNGLVDQINLVNFSLSWE